MKLNFFDVKSGIDSLVVCPVSRAAAVQRAGPSPLSLLVWNSVIILSLIIGRAGRTEDGKCFRLMTESAFHGPILRGLGQPSHLSSHNVKG